MFLINKKTSVKTPLPVQIASAFIILCAFALIVFAVAMIMANYGNHTSSNTSNLPAQTKQNITGLAVFIIAAACALLNGTYKMLKTGRQTLVLSLLGIPLAIGCVGETIDAFGTAGLRSDLIGAGILLLFAIPIVLLILPSSRQWAQHTTE